MQNDLLVSWQMVQKMAERDDVMIIDLREPEKYQMGHYKEAENVPYEEVERWLGNRSRRISYIFYCEYGNQSLMTARKARKDGRMAYSVNGGFNSYALQKME